MATNDGTGFSDQEREAMRAATRERNAQQKAGRKRADDEKDVVDAIAAMEGLDRELASKIHQLVTTTAPQLAPKTWYGMPAYALDGKVVCFFQAAKKFDARYATFGFNDKARLDDGNLWPTSFAVRALDAAGEAAVVALVKKAVQP